MAMGMGRAVFYSIIVSALSFSQHSTINLDLGRGLQKYKTKLKPEELVV